MFRRRRLTAPLDRAAQLPPGPLLRRLEEAHRLLNQQQYNQAGAIYEELARAAQIRDPLRAPQLYLQAGRASLLDGDEDRALRLATHGLGLLAADGRWPRLLRLCRQFRAELSLLGKTRLVEALDAWLASQLPQNLQETGHDEVAHPLLPTICPFCGGPLHPAEVEWVDAQTAECGYCGQLIRPEVKS